MASHQGLFWRYVNGFGMKTAEVVSQNNVPKWIANAMRWELKKVGCKVSGGGSKGSGVTLNGSVLHVYCSAYFTYEGQVHIRAKLAKDGKSIFERAHTGKGSAGA